MHTARKNASRWSAGNRVTSPASKCSHLAWFPELHAINADWNALCAGAVAPLVDRCACALDAVTGITTAIAEVTRKPTSLAEKRVRFINYCSLLTGDTVRTQRVIVCIRTARGISLYWQLTKIGIRRGWAVSIGAGLSIRPYAPPMTQTIMVSI